MKIKNHEKQRLVTLKRLKRGDDKEKPKTGEGGRWKTAQAGRGDRRRKKNKTGSYSEKLATMLTIQT